MPGSTRRLVVYQSVHALAFVLFCSAVVCSEQLPIKHYTTADGLPVDIVERIKRDSHGFLWFCTRDGLSKFDGYQFTSYGREQGLPHPRVNDLLESGDGTYWVATNGDGVCSFNPAERAPADSTSRFKVYSLDTNPTSNIVNRLCEDRQGRIWAGTDLGLFYFDKTKDQFTAAIPDAVEIYSLMTDRQGELWIGSGNQLLRQSPGGRLTRYSFRVARNPGRIFSLLEDDNGKLLVGTWFAGLIELKPKLLPLVDSAIEPGKTNACGNHYTVVDGAPIGTVQDLHISPDGHLWIAASPDFTTSLGGGLFEFDGQRFRRYGKAQGLMRNSIWSLEVDSAGNLWLGGLDGALKIARNGFITFGEWDGLAGGAIAMFEDRFGELCVITEAGMAVNRFEDGRFISTRINVPAALKNRQFWGSYQVTLQDHEGDWWVPTLKGLMRFAKVARIEQLASARPKAHYMLQGNGDTFDIFRMFEDSRGDIWVGLGTRDRNRLLKWERATEKFRYYTERDGVPPMNTPTTFCEDAHGNVWIGLYGGGLLRYREGGFTLFGAEDGLPSGRIVNLHLDRGARLWIGSTSDGVARIDDTSRDRPAFSRLTAADGLSSNVVYSITEDKWGRIYIGTPRSVDRLNPATGNIKRYTTADGLPSGGAILAFRESAGALWFGGSYEVARLVPEPESQLSAPPILITGLRVAGRAETVADLGESFMRGFEFRSSQNQVEIDFVGLAFGAGETLEYQYRLDGANKDWQPMTWLRAVNYANLAPGRYRFLVRAMNAEGQFSPTPASVEFTILAPIYQRWWFVAIVVELVGLMAYGLYRYRVRRLIELERVRTRIAADLHDDIGANLTKIGILSEVVRQQAKTLDGRMAEPLSSIARISRESVASMSDIVWAIKPGRDTLRDLTRRMREFAGEIFSNRNIEFELGAPASETYLKLGADVRRGVFLIFKEAVNNIVRHSDCDRADIDLRVEGSLLVLTVSDDGNGFDAMRETAGNGLPSMRSRAASIGGEVEISSREPSGTRVTLRLPIKHGKVRVAKRTEGAAH
ncbi:MAG TPA: two-component regulator propeller domain-containing protein [Blastocatellia bacterium]|nr:two-component regulator propeller domain-containing protein [Blastocatellia bacterium]